MDEKTTVDSVAAELMVRLKAADAENRELWAAIRALLLELKRLTAKRIVDTDALIASIHARPDPDGTATGKTILTTHSQAPGAEGTVSIGPGDMHVDLETGKRTPLE